MDGVGRVGALSNTFRIWHIAVLQVLLCGYCEKTDEISISKDIRRITSSRCCGMALQLDEKRDQRTEHNQNIPCPAQQHWIEQDGQVLNSSNPYPVLPSLG